jgi:DNA repair photolyase
MPLITDSEENLSAVASAAAQAGAIYFTGAVLFLKPCAQKAFFPFLEVHYPHLVKKYRDRYEKTAFIRGSYEQMIAKRVSEIRQRFGLADKPDRYQPDLWEGDPQFSLFDGDMLTSSPSTAAPPPHSRPERHSPSADKELPHRKFR